MTYKEIQDDVVRKYRIDLCDGTKCRDDWSRTHAHVKIRRVCKWRQANSMKSTFTLLHEVGHIENNDATMRRAEEEFHATIWALERAREYGMEVPEEEVERYQRYINMERDRGLRRGGKGYGNLDLREAMDERHPSLYAVMRVYGGRKGVLDSR